MVEHLVVLDRDGVINQDSDQYIKGAEEWDPIPGSIDAIARLCHGGFRVCVVSNQSGLGRGLFGLAELNAMHRKLRELLATQGAQIEMIAFCPHVPAVGCSCRKPEPGLLLAIGERLGVSLRGVPFIGDSLSDVLAARAAQMTPYLVCTGKGEITLREGKGSLDDVSVFPNLAAAAEHLVDAGPLQ